MRHRRLLIVGLMAMAALMYFARLGVSPLRINAEKRCAAVVETMVATDDLALPRLNGEIRLNKPPLYYWAASACAEAAGGFSLTALRLPSALSALGLLAVVLLWGELLGARKEGLLAAAMLAVTYIFVQQARLGSYEMMLAFFCSATLLALAAFVRKGGRVVAAAAAVLFSLALLTKGTPAFAFALLPAVAWAVGMGKKRWLVDVRVLAVFGATLIAGLSWYGYLVATRPDARDDILAIALLPFGIRTISGSGAEHYEPFHFYLTKIWEEMFPVSLLLPLAAFHARRSRWFPSDSGWRLLLLAFAIPLAVLSLMPQKQDHYLLSIAPPAALLCAAAAVQAAGALRGRARLLLQAPAWIACVFLLLLGAVAGAGFFMVSDWPPAAALAAGAGIAACGIAAGAALTAGRWSASAKAVAAGFALVWTGYFAVLNPVSDNFGSGRIYFDPDYDRARWTARFQRYPVLVKLLDVKKGLKDVNELQEELRRTAAPPPLTGAAPEKRD